MQSRCEEFLGQAAECLTLADHYGDFIKQQYQQLAGQWLFLAEQRMALEECRERMSAWQDLRDVETHHCEWPSPSPRLAIVQA
ncbi:MAG TPA: hypothetical protein VH934_03455 [Xanthobacteraceae bacterium]|jgi:hypothetical protein